MHGHICLATIELAYFSYYRVSRIIFATSYLILLSLKKSRSDFSFCAQLSCVCISLTYTQTNFECKTHIRTHIHKRTHMANVILHSNISHVSKISHQSPLQQQRPYKNHPGDTYLTRGVAILYPPVGSFHPPPDTFCMHKTIRGDTFQGVILFRVTGNAFQALAATTGKARSPSVEHLDRRRYQRRDGVITPCVSSSVVLQRLLQAFSLY